MDARPKIVILESDEMFAALLAETLGDHYNVAVGSNGLQGIAMCLEGGVAAVVTEVDLPDFDGVQMVTELSKNPVLSSIPVLVITATDFIGYSRAEVERFAQVRGIFYKSEVAAVIVEKVRGVLQAA